MPRGGRLSFDNLLPFGGRRPARMCGGWAGPGGFFRAQSQTQDSPQTNGVASPVIITLPPAFFLFLFFLYTRGTKKKKKGHRCVWLPRLVRGGTTAVTLLDCPICSPVIESAQWPVFVVMKRATVPINTGLSCFPLGGDPESQPGGKKQMAVERRES